MRVSMRMKESGSNQLKRNHMKKCTLIMLAAVMSFAACQEVGAPLAEENVLSAVIEQDETTKTVMDDNNNILWSENEQIVAFMKSSYGHKYQVNPSFVGKSYADFSMISSGSGNDLSAGNEWNHNVVYYPYSSSVECLKSGDNYTLDVVLPSEQTYAAESFGNGSMVMVAVSEDNNIVFKNVLGGMKLQLRGTQKVKSITLQGKNNEKLSGAATVTAYADETKPAITMASGASTSITWDCGAGVQLNESSATEFIIALPPVVFSKGFTVTVTDADGKAYTVETDKANTVLRSSLLNMPAFKLGSSGGDDSGDEEEDNVPVGKVTVDKTSLTLTTRFSYALTAKITPIDATDQSIVWSSDNASVVTVDQSGVLTTLSSGTAVITAEAGGVTGTCTIKVIAPTTREVKDYEVDGISYGKGIVIGDVIWAPVNCGYEPATSDSEGYPYGKLYQWGRKYGQGYSTSYDASAPEIVEGPISAVNGQKDIYSNTFFTAPESPYDWASPQKDDLWNSGTEDNPVKTENDPCPKGWRVPTNAQLAHMTNGSSIMTVGDQKGCYFSGDYTYLDNAPQVFFPAAGSRYSRDGSAGGRGSLGYYWSSSPGSDFLSSFAYLFLFSNRSMDMGCSDRADGYSVRCVQE